MKGKGLLMVRAVVSNPSDRRDFDAWYEREHLPDAVRIFQAERGWRCWAVDDPSVHIAFYEFADPNAAKAITSSAGLRDLVAEFDRCWGDKVARERTVLSCVGEEGASAA